MMAIMPEHTEAEWIEMFTLLLLIFEKYKTKYSKKVK